MPMRLAILSLVLIAAPALDSSSWPPSAGTAALAAAPLGRELGSRASPADVIKSAKSGSWSEAATWEGGSVPGAGAKVLVRPGHTVLYDVVSDQALRGVYVGGTLRFATDRDTRLDTGVIKVQAGEDCVEDGFTCDVHL